VRKQMCNAKAQVCGNKGDQHTLFEHSYFYPRTCFYVSELERLENFLISCDFAPLWTSPSERKTACSFYSSDHTAFFNP